jgi:hypothetical protein
VCSSDLDRACREIVRKFLGRLALEGKTASARTAAYCKGRRRVRREDLDAVHRSLVRNVRAAYGRSRLWRGRRVKVVDGSSVSMPDTRRLQAAYPQPRAAKPGCGFPVLRVVALFCLGTGVLIDWAGGSLRISERALFRALWKRLAKGDVVLADRGFCGFAEFHCLRRRGVDSVMRLHARRAAGVTVVRRLGRRDRLVRWLKGKTPAVWLPRAAWAALPDTLLVRQIEFSVPIRAFRTRRITLATTLLDPRAFPAEAFADLYRRRWTAELSLRDLKTTLGMDVLRCKTPEMVHKELTMFVIAHNLIRLLILQAAQSHPIPLERISFKGTVATLRSFAPLIAGRSQESERQSLVTGLLRCLADDPLPLRPNRVEPRARKRRPKSYQLLTKPRRLFREIPHRNRYSIRLS